MQIPQRRLVLGFLVLLSLAAGTAAEAYEYCGDITCFIPPRASCSQECLYCDGINSGTEYPYPPYCDNPSVGTVGQFGCPCYQASVPDLDAGQVFELDLEKLLSAPAQTQGAAPQPSAPAAGQR
jgi:hypothetical protein